MQKEELEELEDIIADLKAAKSIIACFAQTDVDIKDQEFGLMYVVRILDQCIQNLHLQQQ